MYPTISLSPAGTHRSVKVFVSIARALASRRSGGAGGAERRTDPSGRSTSKLTAPGGVASLMNDTVAGAADTFPAMSSATTEKVHVPSWSTFLVETRGLPPVVSPDTLPRSFSTVVAPLLNVQV